MNKVNLKEKFSLISEYWTPKIIGELNNQHVKLVKVKGDFVFHKHDDEDELFMVIYGSLKIEFKTRNDVYLGEGEMIIIPKGEIHRPVAENEAHLLLFEPASTLNTGNVVNEKTVNSPDKI